MRLLLPMAFGLLVFASVAWGEASKTPKAASARAPVAGVTENDDRPPVFPLNLRCIDWDDCGPKDIKPGFDVVTGRLGLNGRNPTPEAHSLETIVNGFDVATGVIGNGTSTAVREGDAGKLETIDSGYNVATGEMGLPTQKIQCNDKVPPKRSWRTFGDYDIVLNVSPLTEMVGCGQTVTYATSTDISFVGYLPTIIGAWRAPMSVAVHGSGTDFQMAIDQIRYLKSCTGPLISQFVSFHIYYHKDHAPVMKQEAINSLSQSFDCGKYPHGLVFSPDQMYSKKHGLLNPRNAAQTMAKKAAVTHYIMVADFGYFPSWNLASEFIKMITWNVQPELKTEKPKAFVLMDFTLPETILPLPSNKSLLRPHLNNPSVYSDYANRGPCSVLSVSPNPNWGSISETEDLRVSAPLKRNGRLQLWNPVFIGTSNDPDFDGRVKLSGERTRGWLLCAQDYEFLILNNAFVVRYPEPKGSNNLVPHPHDLEHFAEDARVMQNVILPEYQKKYGRDKGCVM